MPEAASTPWFSGVCDDVLHRFRTWLHNYERGQVYATRQFLSTAFEKVDRVVQYVHEVPFTLPEMTHLVRMLEAAAPKSKTTEDFTRLLGIMLNPNALRNSRDFIKASKNGFVIAILVEKIELIQVIEILEAVKEGRRPSASALEAMAKQKK